MRPRSRWIAALTLVPAFLAACSDTPPTGVQPTTTGPLFQISDAGNSAGRAGFYFLPPMVPDPGPFTGTFDANLSPEVRVCQLAASECGTTIKTFTLTTAEPVVVSVPKGTYGVNWVTKDNPSSLTTNVKYRVEIRVGTQLLGFADLAFVMTNKDLGSIAPGTVGEVLGSPVNIKFRIETGVVGSVTITPPTASIALPGDQTFSAEVRDLHGVVMPNAAVTWSSANTAAATVSPASGGSTTATGVAAGNAVITAVAGGIAANANLTVMRKPDAKDDSYSGTVGVLLSPGATPALPMLLANDDAGSPAGTITSVWVDGTDNSLPLPQGGIPFAGGTLQVSADGNFSVSTTKAGQHTFRYTLTNAAGSDVASVSVTMGVGSPTAMIALSSTDQTAPAGTAVAEPPSVRVVDQWGNPVAGVAVTFAAVPVGSVTGSPATTDANGVATVGTWTVGTRIGTDTRDFPFLQQAVNATAGPLTKQFVARAVAGAPASLTLTVVAKGTDRSSPPTIFGGEARQLSAVARDLYGNAIYTNPVIEWQGYAINVATVSPVTSQSSPPDPGAKTTVTTKDLPTDATVRVEARLSASPAILASITLTVTSRLPLAKPDTLETTQVCTFGVPGLCLTVAKVDGNVLADNGAGPDFLGPPGDEHASVTAFAISESGPWFQAGDFQLLKFDGVSMVTLNVLSDGTLHYLREDGAVPTTYFRLWYRLVNSYGESIGSVAIKLNAANP